MLFSVYRTVNTKGNRMLYELVLRATYSLQNVLNRWNYVSDDVSLPISGSLALATAFGAVTTGEPPVPPSGTILDKLKQLVSTNWQISSVFVRAIYSPTDFYETAYSDPWSGETAGEGLSPVMAFGFQSNRVNLDIRRATKRFAGVSETLSGGGGLLTAPAMVLMSSLAELMSNTLTHTEGASTLSFVPCVVQRESYETESGRTAYRYYASPTTQAEHTALGISWIPYDTVRSQTSRQYGRGI